MTAIQAATIADKWPNALMQRRTCVVLADGFVFRLQGLGKILVEQRRILVDSAEGANRQELLALMMRSASAAQAVLAGSLPLRGAAICDGSVARLLLGGPRTGTTTLARQLAKGPNAEVLVDGIVPLALVGDTIAVMADTPDSCSPVPVSDVTIMRRTPSSGEYVCAAWQPTLRDILDLTFLRDFLPACPNAPALWRTAAAATILRCQMLEAPSPEPLESLELADLRS